MPVDRLDPERRITIDKASDRQYYNLSIDGKYVLVWESYAVCDQVREYLYGHRAGVCGECAEVAESILTRYPNG